MKATTKLTLDCLLGIAISVAIWGPVVWYYGPMADHPPEVKIGEIIFIALMTFYYAMTHRTPDKTKLQAQVRIAKWLSDK